MGSLFSKRFYVLSIVYSFACLILIIALNGIMIFVIPPVKDLYMDFDADLPVFTDLLVSISDVTQRFWLILIPVYLIISAGISILVAKLTEKVSTIKLAIGGLVALFLSSFILIGFLALVMMPLYDLKSIIK